MIGFGAHVRESLVPAIGRFADVHIARIHDPYLGPSVSAPYGSQIAATVDGVIDPKRVDALVIAATPEVHYDSAAASLKAGIPTFIEKPASVDADAMRALCSLSENTGTYLAVGHNYSFSPALTRVQRFIQSSDFGEILNLNVAFHGSKPRGPRWGMTDEFRAFLLSHATHAFDIALFSTSDVPLEVESASFRSSRNGHAGTVLLSGGSSLSVCVSLTNLAPRFDLGLTAISNAGRRVRMSGLSRVEYDGSDSSDRIGSSWSASVSATDIAGYVEQFSDFFHHVQNQRWTPTVMVRALRGLEIIDQIIHLRS
ncbi:Gfo/Idh/MocA family oxidoreductase [Sinomonas albida]|uniref:Gfo/Idh/MocA family protein n=1 Tax=Sinomonas albida TaxID=369942 RepID=UPI0030161B90